MNVAAYTGRLVDTPELKATNSGVSVTSFTIAVKRPFAKDKSDFIDCVAWKEKAEFICNYFQKGMKIEVDGYTQTRIAERQGSNRKYTELVVNNASFAESKGSGSGSNLDVEKTDEVNTKGNQDFEEIVDDDDDLPF